MEKLKKELDELLKKLENYEKFKKSLEKLESKLPFNEFEYIIAHLIAEKIISIDHYKKIRKNYIKRNKYLHLFEINAPRGFGDNWGRKHIQSIVSDLKSPNNKIDPNYKNEYDLILKYKNNFIKIEVKTSRAVDSNKACMPLYKKALDFKFKKPF